jgi:hypothetical protein
MALAHIGAERFRATEAGEQWQIPLIRVTANPKRSSEPGAGVDPGSEE